MEGYIGNWTFEETTRYSPGAPETAVRGTWHAGWLGNQVEWRSRWMAGDKAVTAIEVEGWDPVKKAQKQAGQALGVGISRELAEAIIKQAKSLGISVQKAALLNISAAMGESGKDPRQFAGQITSLM